MPDTQCLHVDIAEEHQRKQVKDRRELAWQLQRMLVDTASGRSGGYHVVTRTHTTETLHHERVESHLLHGLLRSLRATQTALSNF